MINHIHGLGLFLIDGLSKLNEFLGGNHYINDKKLKEDVTDWLSNLVATEYAESMGKIVECNDKCFSWKGEYVEKLLRYQNKL